MRPIDRDRIAWEIGGTAVTVDHNAVVHRTRLVEWQLHDSVSVYSTSFGQTTEYMFQDDERFASEGRAGWPCSAVAY